MRRSTDRSTGGPSELAGWSYRRLLFVRVVRRPIDRLRRTLQRKITNFTGPVAARDGVNVGGQPITDAVVVVPWLLY
jgi:hypothetical protein